MVNNLDFAKFFELKYILSQDTSYNFNFFLALFIIFAVLIIFSLVGSLLLQKQKILRPISSRLLKFGLTVGLSGLILTFTRYENLPLFSMKLWLMMLALISIIWLILLTIFTIRYLPKAKDNLAKQKIFEKYLPRKKGK